MTATAAAAEAISAARSAVAGDVADVTAAIDTATATIDEQLATLHDHRQALEKALGEVNDQIATVDAYRAALTSARAQVATDDGQAQPSARERGRSGAQANQTDVQDAEGEGQGEEQPPYLEFTEEELDPELARSTRIVTVLDRAQDPMHIADIAGILNEFGDDTTTKVVGGTLSTLARRNAVTKVAPGVYTIA